jgi:chromatin segregation and condensation protein Rec8/ScpA/Scc1 (kleisin family)
MKTKLLTTATLIVALLFANASFAADGHWAQTHPRRHEVNSRLANQNDRIHDKVEDGKMSKGEAAKLHHEDHQVRQEERDMASQNHGHITKSEQRTLNQQENHISRQIHNH